MSRDPQPIRQHQSRRSMHLMAMHFPRLHTPLLTERAKGQEVRVDQGPTLTSSAFSLENLRLLLHELVCIFYIT